MIIRLYPRPRGRATFRFHFQSGKNRMRNTNVCARGPSTVNVYHDYVPINRIHCFERARVSIQFDSVILDKFRLCCDYYCVLVQFPLERHR